MEQQVEVPDGFFPWDDIPDSGLLPEGIFQMRGEKLEEGMTGTGKKRISLQAIVEQPEDMAGMRMFENFTIGSAEDLLAKNIATWKKSVGMSILKNDVCKAANIPPSNEIAVIAAAFAGSMFVVDAIIQTQEGGDWHGTKRNKFQYYKVGERAVGAKKSTTPGVGMPQAPAAPPVAPSVTPAATPPPPSGVPAVETTAVEATNGSVWIPGSPTPPGFVPCGNCNTIWRAGSDFASHAQECMRGTT